LRGEVSFHVPTPITGRLQGIGPTGDVMTVFPLQDEPSSEPAVRMFRSGVNDGGKLFMMYVDTLFGRFCCMNLAKSGVTTVVSRLIATPDRSRSPDMK
jgi:hypothetical protein